MNMQFWDWVIVVGLVVALTVGALRTRKYTKSVSAFLAADRSGGRYLLSVALGMAQVGVISLVWFFEQNYDVGYTSIWWGLVEGPAMIVMALSGWVIYRYRQTRAMTLAQFFEMRYSRAFRIFAGLTAFLAGILNFGIFPSVGARFFMYLCGLPDSIVLLGYHVSMFPLVMLILLIISLVFTFLGGQIAVMVTDFMQGVFCNLVFAAVIIFMLYKFNWAHISSVLMSAPAGKSLVNPFDLGKEHNFNMWYYIIGVVIFFYGAMSWQGTAGYNCSAKSAHESKMAGILSGWRVRVLMLITLVLPICVRTYLENPSYAGSADIVKQKLAAITIPDAEASLNKLSKKYTAQVMPSKLETTMLLDDNRAIPINSGIINKYKKQIDEKRSQARAPLAVGAFLPPVILGLFCAAMLGAFISTHDTYLHSWGSMFIQDVVLPFRKNPLTPRQHIWLLRGAILAVAVYIFMYSLLFEQTERIAMYCARTAAVFMSGAGAVIIGGLYWKRGSTAAAWSAMITGLVLSIGGILAQQYAADLKNLVDDTVLKRSADYVLDMTGQVMTFWTCVIAVLTYVLVSLLGPKHVHNMDRLLHRGKYAIAGDGTDNYQPPRTIAEKLGFTSEFSRSDKIVTVITLIWPLAWFLVFVVGSLYYLLYGISNEAWLGFWHWWTWAILVCSVIVTIWFTIGGFIDIRYLFRRLRQGSVDEHDDGRVEHQPDDNFA